MKDNTVYMHVGNFRLSRADECNLMIEQFKTVSARKGRYVKEARESDKWVFVAYYGNVHQALHRIFQETVADNLGDDVAEIMSVMKDTEEAITHAVKDFSLTLQSFPQPEDNRGKKVVASVGDVDVTVKQNRKVKV